MARLRTLAPTAALVLAACAAEPDPAQVRLAALTAGSAVDALDDLQAVDDPGAAGVRDRFRDATQEALEAASRAHATAPAATADAYARSLEAAEAAERFGDAMALALKALAECEVAEAEALTAQRSVARIEAAREFYWTKREERDTAATGDWRRASAATRDALDRLQETRRDTPPSVRVLYEDDKGGSPEHAVAETNERVRKAAGLRGILLEDLAPKIEVAEAAVDETIAAYREARDSWRALAAGEAGQPP